MKLNQKQKVMRHLMKYGTITPLDAFRDYGIMRLAAVIFNLKEDGEDISSKMTSSSNRFGEKVVFSEYRLENVVALNFKETHQWFINNPNIN
tara:strand:+ start:1410 stop:1685 length:276 start_codon:yes stop_codon:yes gene_type:complete